MSVLKNKRKASQFEVFHHAYQMRKDMTDLILRDFGYKPKMPKVTTGEGALKTEAQLEHELKSEEKRVAFQQWYIASERDEIMNDLRCLMASITMANSIYPASVEEYNERRCYQDKAIGYCQRLLQELQYVIETLPVDVNRYTRFADEIQQEVALLRGWRKSDNKYKKSLGIL